MFFLIITECSHIPQFSPINYIRKSKKIKKKLQGFCGHMDASIQHCEHATEDFGVLPFVTLRTVQFSRGKGFLGYLVDLCGRNKLLISTSYPQLISIRLFISASKITDQLITSNSDNSHEKHKHSNLHYIEIKNRLTYQNNQKTIIL